MSEAADARDEDTAAEVDEGANEGCGALIVVAGASAVDLASPLSTPPW